MRYRYIQDPAHGWLEVTRGEVNRLGIGSKISPYSYQKGENCYLEEDCDMYEFIQAKKARGEAYEFYEIHQENTPIRNYQSYRGEHA